MDRAADSEIEALQAEFDLTHRELSEMAEEIETAEHRLAALARQDVQVGSLREMLADARREHARLEDRQRALRARFDTILRDRHPSVH